MIPSVVRVLGLIVVASYPAFAAAQDASYPNQASSTYTVTPAAYEQPAYARGSTEGQPQSSPASPEAAANSSRIPLTDRETNPKDAPPRSGLGNAVVVAGSLAAVLGVFFLVVWLMRRASPGRNVTLPNDVFEILGRASLAHQQQTFLLRCGTKLLLVAVSTNGARTLTEITDPVEAERLTGLCRQVRSGAPAASFRQVFRQLEKRHV